MDGRYFNLWSTDNDKTDANDDVVIKTVYDPSPVGYSLPASNAFTGFTTTGQNVGVNLSAPFSPEQVNAKLPFDKGWYFYTKLNKAGDLFFFPASGNRYYTTSSLGGVTTGGFYWVAGHYNRNDGRNFYFYSGYVVPLYNSPRSYGLAVRSAEEK